MSFFVLFSKVTLVLLVPVCLVTGCFSQNAVVSNLQTYQQRLQNILVTDYPNDLDRVTLTYPENLPGLIDVPQVIINLRDLYGISECNVNTLIAQRNTALGKVQLPSTRLAYEAQLMKQLRDCLSFVDDQTRQQQIKQWIDLKQPTIDAVWAVMVQSSIETKRQLSSNQSFISGDDQDHSRDVIAAWQSLVSFKMTTSVDGHALEEALNQLRQHTLIANNWRTQRLFKNQLSNINRWLAVEIEKLDCSSPKDKQTATYLANVFRLFFIERLQPIAGRSNHYHYQYEPILTTLLASSSLAPEFVEYVNRQLAGFESYRLAMTNHITLWQQLARQCSIPIAPES